jgi:hypothetical protein
MQEVQTSRFRCGCSAIVRPFGATNLVCMVCVVCMVCLSALRACDPYICGIETSLKSANVPSPEVGGLKQTMHTLHTMRNDYRLTLTK